jgi:hypothetical protein
MRRSSYWSSLAVCVAALVLLAACGDDSDDNVVGDVRTRTADLLGNARTEAADLLGDGTPQAGGNEDSPRVDITSLDDGDTLDAGDIEVVVDVEGFDVVDKLGEPARAGEGHVHFYMDVDRVPTTPGQPAVTQQGTYHAEATTTHTWKDVPPGKHTFAVQLVNNDHTPLSPPVVQTVEVTVE